MPLLLLMMMLTMLLLLLLVLFSLLPLVMLLLLLQLWPCQRLRDGAKGARWRSMVRGGGAVGVMDTRRSASSASSSSSSCYCSRSVDSRALPRRP